jgi:hypothetical protein
MSEFVGYQEKSIAYHADNGKYYIEGSSFSYGCRAGSGDTVGCGITKLGDVFFTLNGKLLPLIQCGINPGSEGLFQ